MSEPSTHVYVRIPAPVGGGFTFRRFVEHVADHSPLFRTTSALAKFVQILEAFDALETGAAYLRLPRPGYELLLAAVLADDQNAVPLAFEVSVRDADGNEHTVPVPVRVFSGFLASIQEPLSSLPEAAVVSPATDGA